MAYRPKSSSDTFQYVGGLFEFATGLVTGSTPTVPGLSFVVQDSDGDYYNSSNTCTMTPIANNVNGYDAFAFTAGPGSPYGNTSAFSSVSGNVRTVALVFFGSPQYEPTLGVSQVYVAGLQTQDTSYTYTPASYATAADSYFNFEFDNANDYVP